MTLGELMGAAFDETWFCVVTPDGEEHLFWNADYIGGHPDVMPELEPLLEREFEEFGLDVRKNPEKPGVMNAEEVPMVYVALEKTEEEKRRDRLEAISMAKEELARQVSIRAEDVKGERQDYARIRLETPARYVVAFREDGGFAIYGYDMLNSMFCGHSCGVCSAGPKLLIRDCEIGEAFCSTISEGRGLALCRRRDDESKECKWEVYKIVDNEDDVKAVVEAIGKAKKEKKQ